jgi:predicted signal transduction protein with EAL and GGDEF domain
MDRMQALFASVSENGTTDAARIHARLSESCISSDDFRLRTTMNRLAELGGRSIDLDTFSTLV